MRAHVCPHCGCPLLAMPPIELEKRHKNLRVLSGAYWAGGILTILLAVLALLGMYVAVFNSELGSPWAMLGLAMTLAGAGITSLAISELIVGFLEIEENTRVTRLLLQRGR